MDDHETPIEDNTAAPVRRKNRGRFDQKMNAAEKKRTALELRQSGLTYQEIADALGYANKSSARNVIESALKQFVREPAEELIELENARIDTMQAAIWPQAMKGHLGAQAMVLKHMERRAKLNGLDRPLKINLSRMVDEIAGELNLNPQERAELLTDMERKHAQVEDDE